MTANRSRRLVVTNVVPVFYTNTVQVPVTNLVDRAGLVAGIGVAGSLVNTFAPGIGSIVALVQGVETARAVLSTTPQGQAADAQFVKWLMEHQKEAGVFITVSALVDQVSDNPAAKLTAQEILERLKRAEQERGSGAVQQTS